MRIVVMGSGGIGGLCGARLAAHGVDVLFVGRGAHLEAMKTRGLRLLSALGDVTLDNVTATDNPAGHGSVDFILFTVKGQDTESAMDLIAPVVGGTTGIINFQNGVEGVDKLADRFGRNAVIPGTTITPAVISTPGVIQHVGTQDQYTIGEWDNSKSARVIGFCDTGKAAGLNIAVSDNIHRDLWWKFVGMASLAAATCLTRLPMRTCVSVLETREMVKDAMREVIAVAKARGIEIPSDTIDRILAIADKIDPKWKTSMANDLDAGKVIEADSIFGSLHRMGAELGVPTPVHSVAYRALKYYTKPHA
jgi:2-dehydropantoate 2-reductase